MMRLIKNLTLIFFELSWLPVLITLSIFARVWPKNMVVGLGPEPLINNIYHARALRKSGWSAETFVDSLYFITKDFDIKLIYRNRFLSRLARLIFLPFIFCIFRYKVLYIYFNGGGLYASRVIWIVEPLLYRIAGLKVVVMPYGGDVQDMQKCPNLSFKYAVDKDYPNHFRRRYIIRAKVWLWSRWADHVISGCDWVDYMQHWDTLCISHFSIDLEEWMPCSVSPRNGRALRILHAPNHKNIKGTQFFEEAVVKLKEEGIEIELIMVQGIPNTQLRALMESCDVIADQLIIGWYAMFAIEAMALGKPVLCFTRTDLEDLFVQANLLQRGELPLINCTPTTVVEVLRQLATSSSATFAELGERGRSYVERRHSLENVGAMFSDINVNLGLRCDV